MKCCHFLAVLLAFCSGIAAATEHPLVSQGVARCDIVVAVDAGPVERHAASELARYLEKITGAKVAIRTAPAANRYPVFLGLPESPGIPVSPAIKARMSEIALQGFMLAADANGLRVIGRRPIGVLYGAYHLLKRYGGVRWFAPGEANEYCPGLSTVTVPDGILVSNPSFAFRTMEMVCCNWNSKLLDTWDWLVRNGMTIRVATGTYLFFRDEMEKRGAVIRDGGHSFSSLLPDSLFDQHPDYFPLLDGARRKQSMPGVAEWPQPCTSNPVVPGIMAASLGKQLDRAPTPGAFLIGNNDDTRWCQCAACTALDPPVERRRGFVSTRYFTLVNRVAGLVRATHPEADLWAWAYQNFQYPPTGVAPDPRLTIEACVHYRCYRHALDDPDCPPNVRMREILTAWKQLPNTVVTREYDECFPGDPPYLPVEDIYCRDIALYNALGISGFTLVVAPPDGTFGPPWNTPGVRDSWPATWQLRYLAAQLAWDAHADRRALLEDCGSKYYGAAWPAMKQYRAELIRAFEETPGEICMGTPGTELGKSLERPGLEARVLGLLTAARVQAGRDSVRVLRVERDREFFGRCWQALHRDYLAARPRAVHAGLRTGNIVVDGVCDEVDWRRAGYVSDFIDAGTGRPADPSTFVRVRHDRDNLFFAIEAMEPSPTRMRADVRTADGPVWQDSSLELDVTAPGERGRSLRFLVNPRGIVYDALCRDGRLADVAFRAGAEVKTRVLADRWVAEIRLPVAACGHPAVAGEGWKINVARHRNLTDGLHRSSTWSGGLYPAGTAFRRVTLGEVALLENGGFEDAAPAPRSPIMARWQFTADRVAARWTYHEAIPGISTLVTEQPAEGRQCLRLQHGGIYTTVNQPADYRGDMRIALRARGKGTLTISLYRYERATGKNLPTVVLKEAPVDAGDWQTVEADYACTDDTLFRLALGTTGSLDLDDVVVILPEEGNTP